MNRAAKTGLVLLLALASSSATAAEPDVLSGRYGHDASEPAYAPVWEVRRDAEDWQARNIEEESTSPAIRLSLAGRRAFWEKMEWPADSADAADCVTWGEAPPSLIDLLQDTTASTGPDGFGNALVCHVPAAVRKEIVWLQDSDEDWFYYDPQAGVMEVRQLR